MMKTSTKLNATGAASLLGVVLAAGGAYAATGSATAADAPGQVLQVSGAGPASSHAPTTATAHANPNARGLFGVTPAPAHVKVPSGPTAMPMTAARGGVTQARPAPRTMPAHHDVTPSAGVSGNRWASQPMTHSGMGARSGAMMR